MKYLMVLVLLLASCSASKKVAKITDLSLVSATQQTVTGGKEKLDGKTRSTSYKMKILKPKNAEIMGVWIQDLGFEYEEFTYEGADYIVVQVYPKNQDNVVSKERPRKSDAPGLVQYKLDDQVKYLEIFNFEEKKSVEGI